ncbi:nucleotide exchange factor GrpE [Blattabacterium cuenoti]|uniref:nucleotide exchange factor GrpE n=1 Tax=Blattabacterium cuenoti TaxID=1653831 RepID=UPI00163C3282|nr:nucleotide exchange factor GrpE [Blattabacterium cuenoti]
MDINKNTEKKDSSFTISDDASPLYNEKNKTQKKHKEVLKESEESESLESLKKEVEVLKEYLKKEKDKYLRIFAEFENSKKRTQKERFDIFITVHEQILIDLIPILDDFERSLKELKKSKDEFLIKGVYLIQEKLIKVLKKKGLKKINIKKGDDFNTDFHEAITQIPAITEDLKGKIIEIIEAGYILKEKVIRHAKVIIGK